MKKAIQFGAGNIGRGFIGAVLAQAGYHVVFADVNRQIIDKINEDRSYTVHIMDVECKEVKIENISGVDSSSDAIVDEIATADLITTAVGLTILPRIAGAIAKGIVARMEHGVETPLNIIACENGLRASSQLQSAVMEHLSAEQRVYCLSHVGFPNCSVDRIVPPVRSENPADVVVEEFYEWNVEKEAFVGEAPHIEGMNLTGNLDAYVERKLFTLNTGHAITAYLGRILGHSTIDQSINDKRVLNIVRSAMQESGCGLIVKHGFDPDAHFKYIDKIIGRFRNPYLKDDVTRVGREPLRKLSSNDRLIKPLITAREYGFTTPNLIIGTGGALHYNNPDDSQSIEMQSYIDEMGLHDAIVRITGISTNNGIIDEIARTYKEVPPMF